MSREHDRALFVWLFAAAVIILGVTLWTLESQSDSCRARCELDGYYPIHVSKASSCLCYDAAGVLRVPTDLLLRVPKADR